MIQLKKMCNCYGVSTFNPGLYGKNADKTKQLVVLHFSDSRAPKKHNDDKYKEALLKSQTGQIMSQIWNLANQSIEDFYITNYVKCLMPEDRLPRTKEYDACKPLLLDQINSFQPKKMILFGNPVKKHFFKEKEFRIEKYVETNYEGIRVLVSDHPGALWTKPRDYQFTAMNTIADFLITLV